MPDDFQFDVFLSHSAKDKSIVRDIAERLKKDGLKVWFDAWEIKPGDSIPAKIEEGLEHSRVLVLCMSANAFGSDWAQLESGTFRFRDPLNKERRFLPLRLDDAPIKGSLAQFLYINWLSSDREQEYVKLLTACRTDAALIAILPHSAENASTVPNGNETRPFSTNPTEAPLSSKPATDSSIKSLDKSATIDMLYLLVHQAEWRTIKQLAGQGLPSDYWRLMEACSWFLTSEGASQTQKHTSKARFLLRRITFLEAFIPNSWLKDRALRSLLRSEADMLLVRQAKLNTIVTKLEEANKVAMWNLLWERLLVHVSSPWSCGVISLLEAAVNTLAEIRQLKRHLAPHESLRLMSSSRSFSFTMYPDDRSSAELFASLLQTVLERMTHDMDATCEVHRIAKNLDTRHQELPVGTAVARNAQVFGDRVWFLFAILGPSAQKRDITYAEALLRLHTVAGTVFQWSSQTELESKLKEFCDEVKQRGNGKPEDLKLARSMHAKAKAARIELIESIRGGIRK